MTLAITAMWWADRCIGQESPDQDTPTVERCEYLLENAIDLMASSEITTDLTSPFDSPALVCPWARRGSEADTYCSDRRTSATTTPPERPPNPDWNGTLFEREILQMIMNPRNHGICRDIFEDTTLVALLRHVPSAAEERLSYYRWRAGIENIVFVPEIDPTDLADGYEDWYASLSDEELRELNETGLIVEIEPIDDNELSGTSAIEFDDLQLALVSAYDYVRSWNYCERNKRSAAGMLSGRWYPRSRDIVIFNGYCQSTKLYEIDVSTISATHRALFTISHEFGHVLENLTRSSSDLPTLNEREAMASVLGSYFAQCGARLFSRYAKWNLALADIHPAIEPIDREYAYCQNKQVAQLEDYFRSVRREIIQTGDIPRSFSELIGESR